MEELSIRIRIANREYPMKVSQDQETRIRNAARLVNERMTVYQEQFGIQDPQDLLAMVAFDCLIQESKAMDNLVGIEKDTKNSLKELDSILSAVLKKDDL